MYTYTFEKREKKEDRYRAREQLIVGNSGQIFARYRPTFFNSSVIRSFKRQDAHEPSTTLGDVPKGVAMPGGQFSPAAISRSILGRSIECDSMHRRVTRGKCGHGTACPAASKFKAASTVVFFSRLTRPVTGTRFVWRVYNATLVGTYYPRA